MCLHLANAGFVEVSILRQNEIYLFERNFVLFNAGVDEFFLEPIKETLK